MNKKKLSSKNRRNNHPSRVLNNEFKGAQTSERLGVLWHKQQETLRGRRRQSHTGGKTESWKTQRGSDELALMLQRHRGRLDKTEESK